MSQYMYLTFRIFHPYVLVYRGPTYAYMCWLHVAYSGTIRHVAIIRWAYKMVKHTLLEKASTVESNKYGCHVMTCMPKAMKR